MKHFIIATMIVLLGVFMLISVKTSVSQKSNNQKNEQEIEQEPQINQEDKVSESVGQMFRKKEITKSQEDIKPQKEDITPKQIAKNFRKSMPLTEQQQDKLYQAMKKPGITAIEFLLRDMDVNSADKSGFSILHMAVKLRRADIVDLLIKKGANINAEITEGPDDIRGWTPLDEALYDTIFRPLYYSTTDEEFEQVVKETVKGDPRLQIYGQMLNILIKNGAKSGFRYKIGDRYLVPKAKCTHYNDKICIN